MSMHLTQKSFTSWTGQPFFTYCSELLAYSRNDLSRRYRVQWNLSIVDTIGTDECILVKEMLLLKRCSHFTGSFVLSTIKLLGFHSLQKCPNYRGVLFSECPDWRGSVFLV